MQICDQTSCFADWPMPQGCSLRSKHTTASATASRPEGKAAEILCITNPASKAISCSGNSTTSACVRLCAFHDNGSMPSNEDTGKQGQTSRGLIASKHSSTLASRAWIVRYHLWHKQCYSPVWLCTLQQCYSSQCRGCNQLQNNTKGVGRVSEYNNVGKVGGATVSAKKLPAGLKKGSSIASAEKLIDICLVLCIS